MKNVELSDKTYADLLELAAKKHLTVEQLTTALVRGGESLLDGDRLMLFLAGEEFRTLTDRTDRYLSILAWCAANYTSDFGDFISQQDSGNHYLMLNGDEIHEVLAQNHARQIAGTQFWAVMTIDDKTRRRFVRRLLEFIGCKDETVREANRALGFDALGAEWPRLLGVA